MYVRLSLSLLGPKATATITGPTMFTFKNLYFMPKLMPEKLFRTVFKINLILAKIYMFLPKMLLVIIILVGFQAPLRCLTSKLGFKGANSKINIST